MKGFRKYFGKSVKLLNLGVRKFVHFERGNFGRRGFSSGIPELCRAWVIFYKGFGLYVNNFVSTFRFASTLHEKLQFI